MKNKELKSIINLVFILVGLYLLATSVSEFFIGLHNTDIVFNALNVADQINQIGCSFPDNTTLKFQSIFDVSDKADDFIERPIGEYYILGMNQIKHNLFRFGISMILIGLFLGRITKL